MFLCGKKCVSLWDRKWSQSWPWTRIASIPNSVQHLGAWIKVDLKEMRAGKEWGFITLIAMPTTHNEAHYRADVVRLEWLKRHEQPCRSEEGEREKGGEADECKWLVIEGRGAETGREHFKMTKDWRKAKNWDGCATGTRGSWRKVDSEDNKACWGNICISISTHGQKISSVIKVLTDNDSNIAPFYFGLNTTLTGIENSLWCHVERWQTTVPY